VTGFLLGLAWRSPVSLDRQKTQRQLSDEYNAKLLVTLRLPRSFKAVAMQFTERR
jgi:hypothetical protein